MKVAVIGAGLAGIAAALQLKRFGIPFALFEKKEVGGLLLNANLVENYPGFHTGISGPDLVECFKKHMEHLSIEVTHAEVLGIEYKKFVYSLATSSGNIEAEYLIIATGTSPVILPIEKTMPEAVRSRTFHEVHPIRMVSGKRIVIVGGGDAAYDYALSLAQVDNTVTIVVRGTETKCLPLLEKRVSCIARISCKKNTEITSVVMADDSLSISCFDSGSGKTGTLRADLLLVAIGRTADRSLIVGSLADALHEIEGATLFFAGDVKNGSCRQAAISAGNGIQAAMLVHRSLESREKFP